MMPGNQEWDSWCLTLLYMILIYKKKAGNLRAPMTPVGITLSSPVEQPSQQDL